LAASAAPSLLRPAAPAPAGALELRSLATGQLKQAFQLPGLGSVGGVSGDRKFSEAFFSYSSFTDPGSSYRVDVAEQGCAPELFRWAWAAGVGCGRGPRRQLDQADMGWAACCLVAPAAGAYEWVE
jgi:hypothetical protein